MVERLQNDCVNKHKVLFAARHFGKKDGVEM
jgi:hypothetical protein